MPVSDPDRSLQFYRDQVGFDLDVDYAPAPDFRVIQLTPQGSGASIQFGAGLTDAPPGSLRGLYLVVTDITEIRQELADRGVAVSEIRHKDTGDTVRQPGGAGGCGGWAKSQCGAIAGVFRRGIRGAHHDLGFGAQTAQRSYL
ncbi:VOC family protein [Mycobacterium florentinum]|uniref:VOC family protein n=1 Tax=Mycobacterium florentinum TaxID=292462 RepID=UPI00138BEA94|nr:VOC family protein [Mycobacterium florentinum]BBX80437.1 hypothetical protein MFLOJ_42240 [Mycobacterium florentinum]